MATRITFQVAWVYTGWTVPLEDINGGYAGSELLFGYYEFIPKVGETFVAYETNWEVVARSEIRSTRHVLLTVREVLWLR